MKCHYARLLPVANYRSTEWQSYESFNPNLHSQSVLLGIEIKPHIQAVLTSVDSV